MKHLIIFTLLLFLVVPLVAEDKVFKFIQGFNLALHAGDYVTTTIAMSSFRFRGQKAERSWHDWYVRSPALHTTISLLVVGGIYLGLNWIHKEISKPLAYILSIGFAGMGTYALIHNIDQIRR